MKNVFKKISYNFLSIKYVSFWKMWRLIQNTKMYFTYTYCCWARSQIRFWKLIVIWTWLYVEDFFISVVYVCTEYEFDIMWRSLSFYRIFGWNDLIWSIKLQQHKFPLIELFCVTYKNSASLEHIDKWLGRISWTACTSPTYIMKI